LKRERRLEKHGRVGKKSETNCLRDLEDRGDRKNHPYLYNFIHPKQTGGENVKGIGGKGIIKGWDNIPNIRTKPGYRKAKKKGWLGAVAKPYGWKE
jgi:hypothetical protein